MEKYKVYVESAYRYFATEKESLDFIRNLLKLNLGGKVTIEEVPEKI